MRLRSYAATVAVTVVIAATLVAGNAPAVIATHVGNAAHSFIVNTSSKPVWVRDVDEARQPFQANAGLPFTGKSPWISSEWVYTVPADKRLVIEGVSGNGLVEAQESIEIVQIRTTAAGTAATHILDGPTILYSTPIIRRYALTETVRLYADPRTQVRITAERNRASGSYANASYIRFDVALTGYFVSVP